VPLSFAFGASTALDRTARRRFSFGGEVDVDDVDDVDDDAASLRRNGHAGPSAHERAAVYISERASFRGARRGVRRRRRATEKRAARGQTLSARRVEASQNFDSFYMISVDADAGRRRDDEC